MTLERHDIRVLTPGKTVRCSYCELQSSYKLTVNGQTRYACVDHEHELKKF